MESESVTAQPKRRGRIPQSDWPTILSRYSAGETLSAIARDYHCTPGAISYIIRKAQDANAAQAGARADDVPSSQAAPSVPVSTMSVPEPAPQSAQRQVVPAQPASSAPAPKSTLTLGTRPSTGASVERTSSPEPASMDGRQRPQEARAPSTRSPNNRPQTATPAETGFAAAMADDGDDDGTPDFSQMSLDRRVVAVAENCAEAFTAWRETPSSESLSALQSALHEVRKAAARVEIVISTATNTEIAPIPMHKRHYRSARR